MKRAKSFNYRIAIAIVRNEFDSVDTVETVQTEEGKILPSKIIDPETIAIKKQLFERLSKESKEVIDTILNGPIEVLDFFASPKERRINKRRIQKYYKSIWSSPLISKSVIKELTIWAKSLK